MTFNLIQMSIVEISGYYQTHCADFRTVEMRKCNTLHIIWEVGLCQQLADVRQCASCA
jgi:hypothetical protein